jgi:hypothetical protein
MLSFVQTSSGLRAALRAFGVLLRAGFCVLFGLDTTIKANVDVFADDVGGAILFVHTPGLSCRVDMSIQHAMRLKATLEADLASFVESACSSQTVGANHEPAVGVVYSEHVDPTSGKLCGAA